MSAKFTRGQEVIFVGQPDVVFIVEMINRADDDNGSLWRDRNMPHTYELAYKDHSDWCHIDWVIEELIEEAPKNHEDGTVVKNDFGQFVQTPKGWVRAESFFDADPMVQYFRNHPAANMVWRVVGKMVKNV